MQQRRFKFTILFLSALVLQASVTPAGDLNYGVKLGINPISIVENGTRNISTKLGFAGGLSLTYHLNRNLAIQPEILYSVRGGEHPLELLDQSYKIAADLRYVEFPVLARWDFRYGKDLAPYLLIGPTFNLLTKANVHMEGAPANLQLDDFVNEREIGLVLNFGVEKKWNPGAITFDLRYERGFTSLVNEELLDLAKAFGVQDQLDIRTSLFSILVGYQF
ncbi:MAG: PorT family protein [Deltaproteobacteria bacterium]|nr:PorT family protein [Deltaproteobacteria bacterium]